MVKLSESAIFLLTHCSGYAILDVVLYIIRRIEYMKNRNIAVVVILSIVTCGIYNLVWLWNTIHALDAEGQASNMSPTVQFVLMFFYVGFILFGINADANLNAIKAKRGLPTSDNKVLYLILGLVVPIVLVCLVQNEINKLTPAQA